MDPELSYLLEGIRNGVILLFIVNLLHLLVTIVRR